MKVKWLGHSSFIITSATGIKVITDPYATAGDLSYGEIKESADIVTVSHNHHDHNNTAAVRGNPKVIREATAVEIMEVKLKGIPCHHDETGGNQRGDNIIFCFEVDGVGVCHLGDLGHRLSAQQIAELGKTDILLIPVGGLYTIDAKVATEVSNQLKPRVIIPMHYQNDKCGFPISGVDEFLQGKEEVSRLDTSEVEFKQGGLPASTRIVVLKSAL